MTIESIMGVIQDTRPGLSREQVRSVATDIHYSGLPVCELIASEEIIDKLVSGYQSRQTATANRVAAEDPKTCPICKAVLTPVKLAQGRDAVYCAKHFVVYPIPPTKKTEEDD